MAAARSRRQHGGSAVAPAEGPGVIEPPPEVAQPEVAQSEVAQPSAARRVAVFALVLLLTVLLALWGAFLVPLRIGGVPVPVGVALALATVPLCRAGGAALRSRVGAAVPLLLWAAVTVSLSSARPEGDLVITGGLRGLSFLGVGLLAGSVTVGLWRPRR